MRIGLRGFWSGRGPTPRARMALGGSADLTQAQALVLRIVFLAWGFKAALGGNLRADLVTFKELLSIEDAREQTIVCAFLRGWTRLRVGVRAVRERAIARYRRDDERTAERLRARGVSPHRVRKLMGRTVRP